VGSRQVRRLPGAGARRFVGSHRLAKPTVERWQSVIRDALRQKEPT
jgi:hypothetical protein